MKLGLGTLKDVKNADLILSMSVFVSTVCSGALTIFLYNKQLFLTIDVSKLTILSIAITAPILAYNSFVFVALYPETSAVRGNITGGGFITIPFLCVAILGRYFFEYSIGVFISIIILLEVVFTLVISFDFSRKYS